ncbi:hypothetical protein LCGC14_1544010 [marine sediment metagenome]|uniref:Uncharacterized protein n=1 Tax=marine sediment metagenome TaxID=412755 RepID=A0A0F9LSZ1_9ZZZZ
MKRDKKQEKEREDQTVKKNNKMYFSFGLIIDT